VRLRVCARALKTVEKNGLAAVAKEHGVDLRALPYVDARPARVDWLAAQDVVPPQSKKVVGSSRKMKNEAKLAASAKAPLVARYVLGGPRVMLTRDPALVADVKVRGAVAP
jgi:large subunit ribosomal protein L28